MKKRMLAMLLCIAMVLSLLPMTALAADFDFNTIVSYAVEGGNIYFRPSIGTICDSDKTITEAVIPSEIDGEAVLYIGKNAFLNCSSLTSVTLPDSVTCIEEHAFSNCRNLTNVTFPERVTNQIGQIGIEYIGERAFSYCSSLTSVSLPDGATHLGKWAFSNCSSLTSVTIPDSISSLGSQAFEKCNSLTDIYYKGDIISWCELYFSYSDSNPMYYAENLYINGKLLEGNLIIPSEVTNIGPFQFLNCNKLTSVIIPDSTSIISSFAFMGCNGLTNVTIPSSVSKIDFDAFYDCSALENVYYAGDLTKWCEIVFSSDESNPMCYAENLYISGKLLEGNLIIPNEITNIGRYTFIGCSSLTSVTIPDSVTNIGYHAFRFCSNLSGIYYTGDMASWCKIVFDVPYLRNYALGYYVCNPMYYAKKLYVNNELVKESLTIPGSLTNVGDSTFEGCIDITCAIIPDGVTSIGNSAFYGCRNLSSVIIPGSITNIGFAAFYGCNRLTDIYYAGTEEEWNNISISDYNTCLTDATIHFNSTGPGDEEGGDNEEDEDNSGGSVRYFSEWDAESQTAYFGDEKAHLGATVMEETDTSFIENLDSLLEQYVLVKTKSRTDGIIGPATLISISPVETKMGTVTKVDDSTITIDTAVFSMPDNWSYMDAYKGKRVIYHLSGDDLVGIEALKSSSGLLQFWDSSSNTAKIDSVVYTLSPLADSDTIEVLEENSGKDVYFVYDSNQYVYIAKKIASPADFERYIYQANSLDRTDFPSIANIRAAMDQDTATDLFISALQENGFEVALGISDLCKLYSDSVDNITALSDFAVEPKDLYEAVVLNALEDDLDASIDVFSDQLEEALGFGKEFTSLIENILKIEYGIDSLSKEGFASLPEDAKQKILKTMEDKFTEKYPNLTGLSTLSSGLGAVLDSVGSIEDCWNRFASCAFAVSASESVKEVVRQAYQESLQANNLYLQAALADCVKVIDSSAAEFVSYALTDVCAVVGKNAMNYLVKEFFWKDVKASIYTAVPGVAIIQCGYKTGQLISNFLFSTDNISEHYAKMKIVNSVTSAFEKASYSLKSDFLSKQTSSTAQTYLSSVDFLFRLWAQDCDEAYGFVDVLDSAMISKVAKLFGSTYYDDTKDALKMKKSNYASERSMVQIAWIDLLDEDYPGSGLSDQYQWIIDQHYESLVKKVQIACPVNVYVYDKDGNLAAYAEDGRVSSTGNVTVALKNDVKTLCFYDDEAYNIQYTGTGTGDMDITLSEFGTDGSLARTVNFFDIPLKTGLQYSMNIDAGILQETTYTVEGDEGTVPHNFDSLLDRAAPTYTATIQSGAIMQDSGAAFSATALAGEELEILAYIPDGYVFVEWQSDAGNDIFVNAQAQNTKIRMPASDVSVYAILKSTSGDTSSESGNNHVSTSQPVNVSTTKNGTVSVTPTSAKKGTKITVTVTPDDGYKLDALTITDAKGNTISVTDQGNGVYTFTMPASKVSISASFIALEVPAPALPFTDVTASDWFYDAVAYAYDNGLMTGTSATTFSPKATTTRGMIVTILHRLEGCPTAAASGFADVKSGAWYQAAVDWAAANGIVNGTSQTTFAPTSPITREQMAAILYRYAAYKGYDVSQLADLNRFSDSSAVSTYAADALAWANAAGLITGVTDTSLSPQGSAVRAQVATILMRFCENIAQ